MKKVIAVLFALMMMVSAAMAEEVISNQPLAGGWSAAADPTVTDEVRELLAKGLNGLVGVNYEPVAYLGGQVVAGRNHAILCQATVVYPDAQPYWVIIYLYENLEGEVELTSIQELVLSADKT